MLRNHLLRQVGGIPTSMVYVDYREDTAGALGGVAIEFTNAPIGEEQRDRRIVLAVAWRVNNRDAGELSVTVGGYTADLVVFRESTTLSASFASAIFFVPAPLDGGSATISITGSREIEWVSVGIYAAYTAYVVEDTDVSFTGPLSLSSDFNLSGIVVGASGNLTNAYNLGGTVTSDRDVTINADQYAFASASRLTAGNYTVTTNTTQQYSAITAAVFSVPPSIYVYTSLIATFGTGDTQTISLPAGIEEGDVLFLVGGNGDNSTASFGTAIASGWTEVFRQSYTTEKQTAIVAYKVMGATPDTTITVSDFVTAASAEGHFIIAVVRGADTTTPLDVTPQIARIQEEQLINPLPITASTSGCLFLCGATVDENTETYGAPTGFILVGNAIKNGGTKGTTTMAQRRDTATTVDPGTFSGDNDERQLVAYTIAVRPAS